MILQRKIMIILLVVFALPVMAQFNSLSSASVPNLAFQSTSTMVGSGSSYSATPTLNADGTASYEGAESSSTNHSSNGPRRIAPPKPEGDPTPIGDAALPLMLMALLYVLFRRPFVRRF